MALHSGRCWSGEDTNSEQSAVATVWWAQLIQDCTDDSARKNNIYKSVKLSLFVIYMEPSDWVNLIRQHSPRRQRRPARGEQEARDRTGDALPPGGPGRLPTAGARGGSGAKHACGGTPNCSTLITTTLPEKRAHTIHQIQLSKQRAVQSLD